MNKYNAEISAGSLMPLESRRLAELLQTKPDETTWIHAVETDNILQKKTPATARRQARLIKRRLTTLAPEGWKLIAERDNEVSLQLLLAAAVKHSQLLGDFLLNVYANRQRRLELTLSASDWHDFLVECTHRDASVASWSETTKKKLHEVIVRILVEAKYVQNSRSMKLTPRSLHPDVRRYLIAHDEAYVLECLERAQ